jgi:putative addiction module killer protein
MNKRYELEEYITVDGDIPFSDWLNDLKDKTAQRKIAARLRRVSFGNFGDFKSIKGAKGLFELREHYGSGYRIFYSIVGNKIILLLAGSMKRDQDRVIVKAKEHLKDYEERNQDHD